MRFEFPPLLMHKRCRQLSASVSSSFVFTTVIKMTKELRVKQKIELEKSI